MPEYLLDTNHISPLVTLEHPLREKILAQLRLGHTFSIATPALHELLFGVALLPHAQRNQHIWARLQGLFKYYAIDETVAEQSAQLRVMLRAQGWQLESIDSMLAVIALKNKLILLSTDKDFQGVPNLQVENWR